MTSTPEEILLDQLDAATRMAQYLERSWQAIQQDVPLSAEQVASLDDDAIDRLDLFLGRFGKLQDFMAGKLFRALARASLEDTSQDVSLLDTLNRMEKFGVLEHLDDWLQIRLLRNAFAHEYLSDNAAIADNINAASRLYPLLARTLERCRDFQRRHIAR
ncbi:hypothetical protein HOP52_09905 [Halomonas campisalis]|uniref:Uncharacterized protein n=1 Tax=Billgrantia campisalis TaxID=74661 RepID=A0ABS9P8H9_9GAMM|nr:hypothetical protein [Halomonas campisalis]MCG6658068.1 hypothetical protein [Halomonas campisalis]MDR5862734.1 hypothetical protein [Halomonas campisalis]